LLLLMLPLFLPFIWPAQSLFSLLVLLQWFEFENVLLMKIYELAASACKSFSS
jgi:hypothetical protein